MKRRTFMQSVIAVFSGLSLFRATPVVADKCDPVVIADEFNPAVDPHRNMRFVRCIWPGSSLPLPGAAPGVSHYFLECELHFDYRWSANWEMSPELPDVKSLGVVEVNQ